MMASSEMAQNFSNTVSMTDWLDSVTSMRGSPQYRPKIQQNVFDTGLPTTSSQMPLQDERQ